jgi:hypothetical protein
MTGHLSCLKGTYIHGKDFVILRFMSLIQLQFTTLAIHAQSAADAMGDKCASCAHTSNFRRHEHVERTEMAICRNR